MSFGSNSDTKERVRQAIDIVDLVNEYVPLRRQGRNFVGLCPWHDDSRPSMTVNPERQSFKCWVCDIGGDIFSFLMKMESVSFPEALKLLAERSGIALERTSGGDGARDDEKSTWLRAMAWAERQYHEFLLHADEAAVARRYLEQRRITADSIRRYHLGFAPKRWDWLLNRGRAAGFAPELLDTVGLVIRRQEGSGYYDRFRARVMFSIRDMQGRPVGLGGRVLPELDDSPAKYINSPETPLFAKSRLLYGLDVARDAILRTRTAVVVEGYTDCIAAHQAGFDNTVAVLGTALGERHVHLLRRLADRIVLVLDGDEAGQTRTNEILDLFVAEQVDLRIATLPEGVDPADFLEQSGSEAFAGLIEGAVDALEHKIRVAAGHVDANDTHRAHEALEDVLKTLGKAPSSSVEGATAIRLREDQILHRLARRFGVPEESLRARLATLRRETRRPAAARGDAHARPQIDLWERELLEVLIQQPDAIGQFRSTVAPEELTSEPCRRLYGACCELDAAGVPPSFDRLMLEIDQPELKNLLVELDERGRAKGEANLAERIRDVVAAFGRRRVLRQRRAQTAALETRRVADEEEELAILGQIFQQERDRHGISSPTDG